MMQLWVVVRGDGLWIWRVAANILNKQSRTADEGWSSNSRLGMGLTTPRQKNKIVTKCHKGPRSWTNSLDKRLSYGKWT
jgi:hypothetical protein